MTLFTPLFLYFFLPFSLGRDSFTTYPHTFLCCLSVFKSKQSRTYQESLYTDKMFASIFVVAVICAWLLLAATACMPRRSDVSLTSRFQHLVPVGNPNTHPWLTTAEAERALGPTRVQWVYTTNASFVRDSLLPIQATINANVPDAFDGIATYNIGRIVNLWGEKITAPWMSWQPAPYYGCANNPAYQAIVLERALRLVQPIAAGGVGSCGLQHDDPWGNYEAVGWPRGGCYCRYCTAKFTAYLLERNLTTNTTFNYTAYLLQQGGYGKGSSALRQAFVAFQGVSAAAHLQLLQTALKASPSLQSKRCNCSFALSGNVPFWTNVTMPLDYAISELAASDATPTYLFQWLTEQVNGGLLPNGKKQVFTMPKQEIITTGLKVLARKVWALCQALGSNMLLPWDIYLPDVPKGGQPRFYGNVSDFLDLAQFVNNNGNVLDACDAQLSSSSSIPRNSSTALWRIEAFNSDAHAEVHVEWTVRSAASSATFVALHIVDWRWASFANDASVVFPLPANPATVFFIRCSTSSLPAPISAVVWLAPNGTRVSVPFIAKAAFGNGQDVTVGFNTTQEMLRPGAVMLIAWTA